MTTVSGEADLSHNRHELYIVRPASWRYVGCMVANVLLVTVLWSLCLTVNSPSIIYGLFASGATTVIVACLTLATIFTLSNSPSSIGRVLPGMGLMAGTAIVLPFSPLCLYPFGVAWSVVLLLIATPLIATGILRLFGLRLYSTPNRPLASLPPWQFSLRSVIAGTVIAAFYALLLSNILEEGAVVQALKEMNPRFGIAGYAIIMLLLVCHVAVATLAMGLWRVRLVALVGVIGLVLILPAIIDLRLPQAALAAMAFPGVCLLSLVGTMIPWWLAGVHTTWEKPVFER